MHASWLHCKRMTQPIVCVFCLCMSVTFARSRARALVFVWVPIFRYHNDLILTNYELKSHFFFSSTILIPIFRGEFPTVLSVSFQFHLSLNTEGNLFPLLITILYCQFGLKREIFKIFQLFTGFSFFLGFAIPHVSKTKLVSRNSILWERETFHCFLISPQRNSNSNCRKLWHFLVLFCFGFEAETMPKVVFCSVFILVSPCFLFSVARRWNQ